MLTKTIGRAAPRDTVYKELHTPAANTAAIVTLEAVAGRKHWVHHFQWSYSAVPTGGRLTITVGGVIQFDVDITSAGPGGFGVEIIGGAGQEIVLTLAAGGASVSGKLNVQYTTETATLEY